MGMAGEEKDILPGIHNLLQSFVQVEVRDIPILPVRLVSHQRGMAHKDLVLRPGGRQPPGQPLQLGPLRKAEAPPMGHPVESQNFRIPHHSRITAAHIHLTSRPLPFSSFK